MLFTRVPAVTLWSDAIAVSESQLGHSCTKLVAMTTTTPHLSQCNLLHNETIIVRMRNFSRQLDVTLNAVNVFVTDNTQKSALRAALHDVFKNAKTYKF